jgi:collagen type VII alpha
MRRSLLQCAMLFGALMLPALTGCAPVGLINPVLGMFGQSPPTASSITASIIPTSVGSCGTGAVGQVSGLFNHPSPAADTASANPASAGNASPGFFSRAFGLFGHSSPTASTVTTSTVTTSIATAGTVTANTDSGSANTANPGLIGDHSAGARAVGPAGGSFGRPYATVNADATNASLTNDGSGGGASAVSQAVGSSGHPSPAASSNTAITSPNSVDTATANPTGTDTPSANNTITPSNGSPGNGSAGTGSADSGNPGFFSRVFGLFGHHGSTTNTSRASNNPATTDGGTAATVSFGTILSMRFVSATNQPGAGIGSATTVMTGARGGGASSFRVAGTGNGAMGMMPATGADGDATPGPQSPLRPGPGQVTEFTLRMDDGSTLTVAQSDDDGLLPGDRVQLIPGDYAHVARAE